MKGLSLSFNNHLFHSFLTIFLLHLYVTSLCSHLNSSMAIIIFSLVFISFPSSNLSSSPSYSSKLYPFAFFHLLLSLSLPLLTLTVTSSCYFSQKLACHNLCRWVISVELYSATMAPERAQPKKSPIPERWHHPLCQRKPHLEYQPTWAAYAGQREDGN